MKYGDMFDHDTVVYEFENGPRLYALCRTTYNCYNNAGDIIMGTKGTCYLDRCEIKGKPTGRSRTSGNNPYQAEQAALVEAIKKNEPINSGYHMVNATMITVMGQMTCYTGQADRVRRSAQVGSAVSARSARRQLRYGAADTA